MSFFKSDLPWRSAIYKEPNNLRIDDDWDKIANDINNVRKAFQHVISLKNKYNSDLNKLKTSKVVTEHRAMPPLRAVIKQTIQADNIAKVEYRDIPPLRTVIKHTIQANNTVNVEHRDTSPLRAVVKQTIENNNVPQLDQQIARQFYVPPPLRPKDEQVTTNKQLLGLPPGLRIIEDFDVPKSQEVAKVTSCKGLYGPPPGLHTLDKLYVPSPLRSNIEQMKEISVIYGPPPGLYITGPRPGLHTQLYVPPPLRSNIGQMKEINVIYGPPPGLYI